MPRRDPEDGAAGAEGAEAPRPRRKRERAAAPPPIVVNVGGAGGAGDTADEEDTGGVVLPPGEPVPMRLLQAKYARRDEPCWGCICHFGSSDYDTKQPFHAELLQLYDRLRGSEDKEEMYHQLAEYHRRGIAAAAARLGEKCTPWPADMVKCHLEWHLVDEYAEVKKTVDGLRHLEKAMEDVFLRNLRRADGRDEWTFDPRAARVHERLVAQKLAALRLMRALR